MMLCLLNLSGISTSAHPNIIFLVSSKYEEPGNPFDLSGAISHLKHEEAGLNQAFSVFKKEYSVLIYRRNFAKSKLSISLEEVWRRTTQRSEVRTNGETPALSMGEYQLLGCIFLFDMS